MKFLDLLYLSFQDFNARKSRFLFTILAVSLGIGAVLFLVSLGFGLQKLLLEKITTAESLLTLDVVSSESKIIALNSENLEKIKNIANVEEISPQAIFAGQASLGDLTSETSINLINPTFFSLSGLSSFKGRIFTAKDKQMIVVNSSLVELFKETPDSILGKKIKFLFFVPKDGGVKENDSVSIEKEFEIIGVIEEAVGSPSQVFLNRDDLPELIINEYQSLKIKVADSKLIEDIRNKVIEMGFIVSALSDTIDQTNKIFGAIQIVLGIFGVIALVVAAIGLVNTMTISLLEKTQEVGIMRAIGASAWDISRIFLSQSLLTGFFGGIGGIIIGVVFGNIINGFVNLLAKTLGGEPVNLFFYPAWFIIFIIVLSTIVGLTAGIWPARKAAKINALDALKYK